ncbi:MAG: phosphohistidine phosphatase SixA [Acidobacteriota bacterium]
MELYLVQHGEAMTKDQNPERPLTEQGMATARRVAALASRLGVQVAEIRHSEKLRAVQTAQVFEQALGAPCKQAPGLTPNDDINPVRREVASRPGNLMLVGHLPFLSRLAGALLAQDESLPVVGFQMAGLVRVDRREDGRWSLRWLLPPEVLQQQQS